MYRESVGGHADWGGGLVRYLLGRGPAEAPRFSFAEKGECLDSYIPYKEESQGERRHS